MIKVDVQSILYFSELDEEYFFTWALELACVERSYSGYLFINEDKVNEQELRELLSLFHRYNVPSQQLAIFCNSENEQWFKQPDAFWYESVFINT